MSAQVENKPDLEQVVALLRESYPMTALIRNIVREETGEVRPRVRRAGLPQSEMKQAMQRIIELRDQMKLPADAFDDIIEEHRREFRRGPLTDEDDDAG